MDSIDWVSIEWLNWLNGQLGVNYEMYVGFVRSSEAVIVFNVCSMHN